MDARLQWSMLHYIEDVRPFNPSSLMVDEDILVDHVNINPMNNARDTNYFTTIYLQIDMALSHISN